MGQYGNQPDFGTRAKNVVPSGQSGVEGDTFINLKSAALYIGTGGTLVCSVVGGNNDEVRSTTVFKNIPDGTFFPVIVDRVYSSDIFDVETTCSDIVALY
jgi:hypothetical protein